MRKKLVKGRLSSEVREKRKCSNCNGSGQTPCESGAYFYTCGECGGLGKITVNPLLPSFQR